MMQGEGQLVGDTGNAGVVAVSNFAVTVVSAVMVTVQGPVPVHPPPLQPVKIDPVAATGVSSTGPLKGALCVLQLGPQVMPAGTEVTVPVPVPDFVNVSVDASV